MHTLQIYAFLKTSQYVYLYYFAFNCFKISFITIYFLCSYVFLNYMPFFESIPPWYSSSRRAVSKKRVF